MKINISVRYTGIILIVLSLLLFFVLLSSTQSIQKLNQYIHQDCTLPAEVCPFKKDIPWESSLGFSIDAIIFILGVLLVMTKRLPEQSPVKRVKKQPATVKSLEPAEKKIYDIITDSNAIFQSELVEKANMSKVKITRILDKLEARGLVERKRRGMTNVVVAKNK
ncbi:MAG: MarR family transcriptional regulator [Candidatus Aenigmatarchaeota archaeon]